MRFFGLFLALAALYGARQAWRHRELRRPAGVVVEEEPFQTLLPKDARPIMHKKQVLQPLANYKIRARLLLEKDYLMDRGADIAPLDICVAWGPMSDTELIEKIKFSQSGRFCFYSWSGRDPVDRGVLKDHVANMHIIPSSSAIEKRLKDLRPGQIVTLEGQLVRADYRDGGEWRSSLSRTDTGNGACELMYVREVFVEAD